MPFRRGKVFQVAHPSSASSNRNVRTIKETRDDRRMPPSRNVAYPTGEVQVLQTMIAADEFKYNLPDT